MIFAYFIECGIVCQTALSLIFRTIRMVSGFGIMNGGLQIRLYFVWSAWKSMWDLSCSWWWVSRLQSCGIWFCVVWLIGTSSLEEPSVSICRVKELVPLHQTRWCCIPEDPNLEWISYPKCYWASWFTWHWFWLICERCLVSILARTPRALVGFLSPSRQMPG
jgi:hypothetical protein